MGGLRLFAAGSGNQEGDSGGANLFTDYENARYGQRPMGRLSVIDEMPVAKYPRNPHLLPL